MVAGMRPSFTSDRQNSASYAATAMSHAATRPTPPAKAAPCTRAMVGFFSVYKVCSMVAIPIASAWFCAKL